MSVWDFAIAWTMQHWVALLLGGLALAAVLMIVGLILSEFKDEPEHPHLSQDSIDKLEAWASHGTRRAPLDADEIVALAQEWLALCRSARETDTRGEM